MDVRNEEERERCCSIFRGKDGLFIVERILMVLCTYSGQDSEPSAFHGPLHLPWTRLRASLRAKRFERPVVQPALLATVGKYLSDAIPAC